MNFLAHIYLSGDDEDLIIGNFIGDFVKGKNYESYPIEIQKGILLHREIDHYTDDHEVVWQSKKRLRPKYHHYAPVIVDVFYDHFLASLWENYHPEPLITFTENFYQLANEKSYTIPSQALYVIESMRRDNWLLNYQFMDGIKKALTGMANRTTFDSKMDLASEDLIRDYSKYQQEFENFFPQLEQHVSKYLDSLA